MRFILCLYKIDCCFKMRKLELARVLCLAFLIKERLTFFKKNINTHIYIYQVLVWIASAHRKSAKRREEQKATEENDTARMTFA